MDEGPNIAELRDRWLALEKDAEEAKQKFREKIVELSSEYTMTELSQILGVGRTALYYHRKKSAEE